MPESPEVQALAEALDERLAGRCVREVDLLEFRALKTRDRATAELRDQRVTGVSRLGKHLDVALERAHLVISLGRHGWVRWAGDETGVQREDAVERPPALAVIGFDDGTEIDVTDAGSWVSIGISIASAPGDVAAIAKLGPDPADASFDRAALSAALGRRRKQVKAILQEQESIAGIGNAYSDEILHAARIAPVTHAAALDDSAREALFEATTATIRDAISARRGVPIDEQKAAKVAAMRVHGRAGEPCPRCGGTIEDLAFGGTSAQWCPRCQTV